MTENFIFLFDYPYKGPNYLEEKINDNIKKKSEIKIEINKLIPKKNIKKNNKKNENDDSIKSNISKGSLNY